MKLIIILNCYLSHLLSSMVTISKIGSKSSPLGENCKIKGNRVIRALRLMASGATLITVNSFSRNKIKTAGFTCKLLFHNHSFDAVHHHQVRFPLYQAVEMFRGNL
jgi:hypothetical protein